MDHHVTDKYSSLIQKTPDAFAYCKVVIDGNGVASDIIYLEVNPAFETVTGLSANKVLGRTFTAVHGISGKEEPNWLEKFVRVARTGQSEVFEQYFKSVDRWYEFSVFSDRPGYFATVFRDVSARKLDVEVLDALGGISKMLLQVPLDEPDYERIAEDIRALSGARFVILNTYLEGNKSITRAISGTGREIKVSSRLLGFDLIGRQWPAAAEFINKFRDSKLIEFNDLFEIGPGSLSKTRAALLSRLFNLGRIFVMELSYGENLPYGYIIMIMPRRVVIKNRTAVESYANQLSSLFTRVRAEKELREKSEELEGFFDVALDLLCIADTGGNFIRVNRAWEELLGYSVAELEQRNFFDFVHPNDQDKTRRILADLAGRKTVLSFTNRYRTRDGDYRYIEWRSMPHGRLIYAAARDVTGWKTLVSNLQESEARSRAIIQAIPDMLFRYDEEKTYLEAHFADEQMLNPGARLSYQQGGLLGKKIDQVMPRHIAVPLVEAVEKAVRSGELQIVNYSYKLMGELKYFEERLIATDANEVVSIVRDITAEKCREKELRYLSMHDSLTGLYNRAYFEEELKRLEGSREYPIAIIMADLDDLKLINDTLGHGTGDKILKTVAGLLKKSLRHSDILARVGGDEFALILPCTDEKSGQELISRIRERIGRYNKQNPVLPLRVSLGLDVSKESIKPLARAFSRADMEMYQDKIRRSRENSNEMISGLLAMYRQRKSTSREKDRLVEKICLELGRETGLDNKETADLLLLCEVYNLGRVAISENILTKEGKLTEKEWAVVRQHPDRGHQIASSSPDLAGIAGAILHLRENWDGSGYPYGLNGEKISLYSRILALADAYSTMIYPRSYARRCSKEEALEELEICSGVQFDPQLLSLFKKALARIAAQEDEQQDSTPG